MTRTTIRIRIPASLITLTQMDLLLKIHITTLKDGYEHKNSSSPFAEGCFWKIKTLKASQF
jgi:hypothetical protein